MRKWTYLVAMLMLAGATTTFTGCIDTDEPAGIEELRGAKAELLRAKATVEAAKVAQVQADAALAQAQAQLVQAQAQALLLKAEYEKAIAEAESAAKIAEIQAQIALLQAQTEAQIAAAEATRQEAADAHAKALIDLAKAQAGLVGANADALKQYVTYYDNASAEYDAAYLAYMKTVRKYNEALTNLETDSSKNIADKRKAESDLNGAKDKLAHAQKELEVLEAELTNAEEMTPSDLQVRFTELKEEKEALSDSIVALELEKAEIRYANEAEYTKLTKLDDELNGAKVYTISAYENESAKDNAILKDTLQNKNIAGYQDGVFSYDETSTSLSFDNDYNLIATGADSIEAIVRGWIDTLKIVKLSANDIANDTLLIPGLEQAVADADTAHQEAVAEWEILVAAKQGTKTEPTEAIATLQKAVTAYNTEFAKLEPAVAAYNNAIVALKLAEDTVGVIAKDAYIAKAVQNAKDSLYVVGFNSLDSVGRVLGNYETGWIAENPQTRAKLDNLLKALGKESMITKLTAKTDTLYNTWKAEANGSSTNYGVIEQNANNTMTTALAADVANGDEGLITPAKDALLSAWKNVNETVRAAIAAKAKAWETAYDTFETTVADNYGQVLSSAQTLATMQVDTTNIYKIISKDADGEIAYTTTTSTVDSMYTSKAIINLVSRFIVANGSDMSSDEITEMIATELDTDTVNTSWETKSAAAWGKSNRMIAMTEDEAVSTSPQNTFYAWIAAKQELADANAGLVINPIYDTLIAEFEAQLVVLEGEVEAAEAAVADKLAAVQEQVAVIDSLEAGIQGKIDDIVTVQGTINQLMQAYFHAIMRLGDETAQFKIDELVVDLKSMIVQQELYIFECETLVMQAEAALEAWNSGEEIALRQAQYRMEDAEYTMNKAKAAMEKAQEYLELALAALQNISAE